MRGTCSDSAIRVATVSSSGPVSTIVRTLMARSLRIGVCLVGLAEKSTIHPAAQPIGESSADRHDGHDAQQRRSATRAAPAPPDNNDVAATLDPTRSTI